MNSLTSYELTQKYRSKIKNIGMQSDVISQIKAVINGSCPDAEKLFSVEGIWAHQKLFDTNIKIKAFLFCPDFLYSNEALALADTFLARAENAYMVSQRVFQKLSERDKPDGLITIGQFPSYDINQLNLRTDAVVAVLDGLEKPGNIGTILRTCDGSGVDAVFICNKKARITNPKLIKGSMGSAFVIPIVEFKTVDDCILWLMAQNFNIYLADSNGDKSFKCYEYAGKSALVLGSERYGLSEQWYSSKPNILSIPMLGICDSLNVGTAASIILYEICMKKRILSTCPHHKKDRACLMGLAQV